MPYVRGQSHPIFHLAAQPPGVTYAGRIVDETLRRVVHLSLFQDQTLAIARTYLPHDEFALIWHFNQQGRIKDLDVEVSGLPARSTRVLSVARNNEPWMQTNASYTAIPSETRDINQHFCNLSTGEKYYQLVRYGHMLAHKIHTHLEDKTMLDPYMRIQGQQSLRLLLPNSPVWKILSAITAIHLSHVSFPVDATDSASAGVAIEYAPFKKKHERTQELRQRLGIDIEVATTRIRQNI